MRCKSLRVMGMGEVWKRNANSKKARRSIYGDRPHALQRIERLVEPLTRRYTWTLGFTRGPTDAPDLAGTTISYHPLSRTYVAYLVGYLKPLARDSAAKTIRRHPVHLHPERDRNMEIEPAFPAASSTLAPCASKPAKSTHSLMWIEKYRPTSLDDLLSHKQIITTLTTLIANNRLPHLLFCGPPGTGKTSTILACARQMYGDSYKSMVLELNASDDRGLSVVRNQIKNFASTRRIFSSGVKLIVLDEADAMTSAAQMALRRVVEKYTANTRFCIICNYVNKIIPALQSRCTKFRFGPLPADDARARVAEIAKLESVKLEPDGLEALLTLGCGDMRRVINVMQSTHMAVTATGNGVVTGDSVYANTGAPHPGDIRALWEWLTTDDFPTCVAKLTSLKVDKGLALDDIVMGLLPEAMESDLPPRSKIYLYEHLADIQYRLAVGSSEKLNVAALIGAFKFSLAMALDAMACE